MAKRKCRSCGSFTECNDIRLCPSCVDDICPTADPRIEMHCEHSVHVRERIAELDAKANELERERDEARKRVAELERERDHANMVADAVVAHVKELEAHRVPNPGVVGTLQDKNTLLEYKDAQIARLQARVQELEARTSDKESDS